MLCTAKARADAQNPTARPKAYLISVARTTTTTTTSEAPAVLRTCPTPRRALLPMTQAQPGGVLIDEDPCEFWEDEEVPLIK